MREKGKLPHKAKEYVKQYGITEEEILYIATSDLTEEYRFTQGYLILTKDRLVHLLYTANEKSSYPLGGYAREHREDADLPACQIYTLSETKEMKVLREVSRGCLTAKVKGTERRVAYFSSSALGRVLQLVRIANKIEKDEEITDEDYELQKKEECCPNCGMLYPDQERKICPKCMDKKSVFFRMLGYFKPYKLKIAVMIFCYIGTAVLNLAWPLLSGTILYDKVLARDEEFLSFVGIPMGRFAVLLAFAVAAMIISKVLIQLLGIIQGALTATIVPELVSRLKIQVFEAMGRLSISFFNRRQTGGLMTRVLQDANEVTGFFIDGLPYLFINILTVVLTVIVMISLDPLMGIVSVALLPFLTIFSYRMMPRLWQLNGKRHRARRSMNSQVNDNLTGARVVKAFGQEESEMRRFRKYNEGMQNAELGLAKYDNKFDAVYIVCENLAYFAAWGLGAVLILNGSGLELGVLLTFTAYIVQLNGPLDFFSFVFRWWAESLNSAQRIFEIIDSVPEIQEKPDAVHPEYVEGEIELKNVTFAYETGKPVLKGISFKAEAGKMLGIVGRSGAGKSTLVNLISRLYDPTEGNIYIDGINLRDMGFTELRRSIAMVSQETYIFMGTVAENIAYARPDATHKEIIEAAIQASAHDFICRMPDGYDTIIGSSGRNLSGGERQRISIARAILANPRILILDEATAAVDTETEQAIQASLEHLVVGRTTLSIAHRLSTLKNADRLIVIDEGKLTEEGTHQELVEKKGTYYKLMQLQTKALAMRGLE